MCVSVYVWGFNEALLTQHISPGMGNSGAMLSEFAWAHCQKIALVQHCNAKAKREDIALLANHIPIILLLLGGMILLDVGPEFYPFTHTCTFFQPGVMYANVAQAAELTY